MAMNSVWLQENKWKDVENYLQKRKTIIIPVGSVEQHAKHLPLGTDSFVAIKLAEDVAKETGTLVAPPLWLGWAPHHMAFPGTITLRPETLTSLLYDVAKSLIYHGFEKLVIINGHREANLPPLKTAVTKLRNETGAFLTIVDPFYIGSEIGKKIKNRSQVEWGMPRKWRRPICCIFILICAIWTRQSKMLPRITDISAMIHLFPEIPCFRRAMFMSTVQKQIMLE